jgi:hypothetical protein
MDDNRSSTRVGFVGVEAAIAIPKETTWKRESKRGLLYQIIVAASSQEVCIE